MSMSDNEGELPVRLSRSWRTKDGVTIPAGTEISVTEEQERELREGGFLEDWNPQDVPVTAGPEEDDEEFLLGSGGPYEDDEEFLNAHRDDTGGY
jgi:hypothetical protein